MSSIADCLSAMVAAGRMSDNAAQELLERAERHADHFRLQGQTNPAAARSAGEAAALASAKRELALQARQRTLQAIRNNANTTRIMNHPKSAAAGLADLHGRSLRGEVNVGNIETRARSIIGTAHADFAEGLKALSRKWFGFYQDRALMRTSVREMFGEATGNAEAKAIAKAWADTAEGLRQRFNAAGGSIGKRADWGLPQIHDAGRVGRAPKNEWVDFVMEHIDPERMIDADGRILTPPEVRFALDTVYERIRTDGLVDMVPGQTGGMKLANRHREARWLQFKDADAWMAYQERFGAPDTFQVLIDHLDRMAHEIAQLEILGPNPAAGYRYLADVAKKQGASPADLGYTDALNRVVTGGGDARRSIMAADIMGAVRNWITSARLGSALLSQISDIGFMSTTARWNDMSATKVMGRFLSLLAEGTAGERRMLAVRAGLTAELFTTRALAANRWTDVTGSGFSARAADFTMRASGMSMWNDSMKKAFSMELMATFAESSHQAFGGLSRSHQRTLRAYGITPDDWDVIRRSPMLEHDSARFVSSEELLRSADTTPERRQALASKWQEMIISEQRFAVPEADARTRVLSTGGMGRGTIGGEVARGVFQFKSFPVSVMLLHMYRGFSQPTALSKAGYLGAMVAGTTVMGMLAMQLKDITRGRQPRDMTKPETWGAAFIQGGGAGIYGDFLFSDVNRFGGGFTSTMLGPTAGLIDDTMRLTVGNAQQAARGEEMGLTQDLIRFAGGYTPGIQLWYSRLAFERAVVDQLRLQADPVQTRRQFRAMEQRARRDRGQEFWWRPGQPRPDTTPDLEIALGGN
jgi:hypothetical protein